MRTAVTDLDGAPEAVARHHQSGVEELTQRSTKILEPVKSVHEPEVNAQFLRHFRL
jgi:hypothetical protein